jgi:hypothetical protein
MRVRVFLRQALFTLPGAAAHLPAKTAILDGTSSDPSFAGGVRIFVEQYLDDKGKALEGAPCEILIPEAKIDHVLVLT